MFWRSNMHSVLVVGAVALLLALISDGVIGSDSFRGARRFSSSLKGLVCGIHTGVDDLMSDPPQRLSAGPTSALVVWGGGILGLDREGVVASSDTACSRWDLPFLTGFVPASRAVGERLSSAEIVVGLEVLRAVEARPEMLAMLSEVNLADLKNPRLVLAGGVEVNLGRGDYRRKVDKLNKVLLHLKRLEATPLTIDLRFARQVVVRCLEQKPDSTKVGSGKEV
jgi:hypothetical protein